MKTTAIPASFLQSPLGSRLVARLPDFVTLTEPRVMALAVFTALVGMIIAPGHLDPLLGSIAVLAIAAGVLNMWCDADLDAVMTRTAMRPIPLVVLAIAQMGVHLVFFLHITTAPDNSNNVMALAFGVLIVLVLMAGTLWVMTTMNHNMMPPAELMNLHMQH
jgi:cytochrome o ubiquinol oxidase subunit IV